MQPPKRILIIEDDFALRRVLALDLKYKGYETIDAGNGLEALALLRKTEVDLILTDIRMPGCDGIEFLRALRETMSPHPAVVFVSGCQDLDVNEIMGLGAVAVFPKPFSRLELHDCIHRAIA